MNKVQLANNLFYGEIGLRIRYAAARAQKESRKHPPCNA
jgi:hypothetical protein